jgi:hypothetical protein
MVVTCPSGMSIPVEPHIEQNPVLLPEGRGSAFDRTQNASLGSDGRVARLHTTYHTRTNLMTRE